MKSPAGTSPVEHWTFQVDSPFRGPAEIRELTGRAADEARGAGLGDTWSEAEDPFLTEFEQMDELEGYEEAETEGAETAEAEAAVAEAYLLEETPASEHPLAAVFSLPRFAFDAMAKGGWVTAIAVAIGAGLRDVNKLTNMIFWFRHPQMIGQKISPDQRDLAREWMDIRDGIVKPAFASGSAPSAPSSPPTPGPLGAAGRTSIPSDGLRWYGPGEATPELMAFMRKVYDLHVKRSRGDFVDTLPETALDEVEPGSGKKARKDAARKAREMLAAARAALAAEGLTGTVRIGVLSAYRSADLQFDIWQGKTTKGKGGFPHYYQETKSTRQHPKYGGEHSDKAAAYLAEYMALYVAAPGYSNHQDGLALDLGTRKGKGGLIKLYKGSWFHDWMCANARTYQFEPLASEAWHWTYRPTAGASEAETWEFESSTPFLSAENRASEVTPAAIKAGTLEVQKIPLLASHRGRAPDLILRWNEMPTVPAEIDVVVHLHGYSWATMTLPKHMEVWAGLDLAPVDGASGAGRSRPTLTVLPRGHFTGVKLGKIYRYTFPALTTKDGLTTLVRVAVEHFANQVGGSPPKVGRLIMTAHSGGGAPLMQILRRHDPHEVHVFDGLYQDPSALAEWAGRHITADRAAVQAGGAPSGAMRVFFGPSTRLFSTRLHNAIAADLRDAPTSIADRYRVESSRLGHWQIPRQYGWRVLADAGAEVPDAKRPPPTKTSVKRLFEVDSAAVPSLPETPFPTEELDSAEAEGADAWELGETATEGKEEVDQLGGPEAEGEPWSAPEFERDSGEDSEDIEFEDARSEGGMGRDANPVIIQHDIPSTATRVVAVGERIDLDLEKDHAFAKDAEAIKWTIPDTTVRSYDGGVSNSKLFELEDADLQRPQITFYWVDAADARVVRAWLTMGSNDVRHVDYVFDVKGPTVNSFTAKTGKTRIIKSHGMTVLSFGNPGEAPGVRWNWKITMPPTHAGYIKDVQTVLADVSKVMRLRPGGRETRRMVWRHPSKTDLHVQLDGHDQGEAVYSSTTYNKTKTEATKAGAPYHSGDRGTQDSPSTGLEPLDKTVSVNKQFTYYLMFKPSIPGQKGSEAIWVPIAKATWFWKATATKQGDKWVFSAAEMEPRIELTTVEFPEYQSNIDFPRNEWKEIPPDPSKEQYAGQGDDIGLYRPAGELEQTEEIDEFADKLFESEEYPEPQHQEAEPLPRSEAEDAEDYEPSAAERPFGLGEEQAEDFTGVDDEEDESQVLDELGALEAESPFLQEVESGIERGLFERQVGGGTSAVDPFPRHAYRLGLEMTNQELSKCAGAVENDADLSPMCGAVVDLTGNPELPAFYANNPVDMLYVGSLAKIYPMYVAFELRRRVQEQAKDMIKLGLSTSTARWERQVFAALEKAWKPKLRAKFPKLPQDFPKLADIFVLSPTGDVRFAENDPPLTDADLDFRPPNPTPGRPRISPEFKNPPGKFHDWMRLMLRWSNNKAASKCIRALTYPYINGVLAAAGFFDPSTKTGLWMSGDYQDRDWLPDNGAGQRLSPRWARLQGRPASNFTGTAFQVARLMTLLAQGRLIDPASSTAMITILTGANGIGSYIKGGLPVALRPVSSIKSKIGFGNDSFSHDCAIVHPDPARTIRYVVVALGGHPNRAKADLRKMVVRFHGCVVARHP